MPAACRFVLLLVLLLPVLPPAFPRAVAYLKWTRLACLNRPSVTTRRLRRSKQKSKNARRGCRCDLRQERDAEPFVGVPILPGQYAVCVCVCMCICHHTVCVCACVCCAGCGVSLTASALSTGARNQHTHTHTHTYIHMHSIHHSFVTGLTGTGACACCRGRGS